MKLSIFHIVMERDGRANRKFAGFAVWFRLSASGFRADSACEEMFFFVRRLQFVMRGTFIHPISWHD
ncbi:hypothetical protein ACA373_04160 [Erwinia sp. STN24]|uniref:hypothetical protein n=1 Tax=Erwinia sp. STN24 TaxID=3233996 RepID=UPI00351FFE2A